MHARQQIRLAVATALTGLASGAAVNTSPLSGRPLEQQALPLIRVSTPNDVASGEEDMSGLVIHALDVSLELIVQGLADGAGLDDALDSLAVEVEAAMFTAFPHAELQSANVTLDGASEVSLGVVKLDYQLQYFVRKGAPEVMI